MKNKRFIACYAAIAILAGGGVYAAVSNADATPKKSHTVTTVNAKPVSLVGKWHQTQGMNGVYMTADISGDDIQVTMKLGNEWGTFWMGSFDTSDMRTQSFTVKSLPDPDAKKAMKDSFFGDSAESSKEFTYNNGEITYDFSMMGVHSIVHLARGAK